MQPLFLFLILKYFIMKNLSFILLAGVTLALASCGVFGGEEATAEVVEEEAADSTAVDSTCVDAVETDTAALIQQEDFALETVEADTAQ
jgi:hypothetical protein